MTTPVNGPETARIALDTLVQALHRHLDSCERRTGENDVAVQDAYDALRAAARRYDDVLFDIYEEVTPWEFAEGPALDTEYEVAPEGLGRVAVLVRRDYEVDDQDRLVLAGRTAFTEAWPGEPGEAAAADITHPGRALYQLLYTHGVDGLDARAEDAGLRAVGGTVWVQALQPRDEPIGDRDPFGVADEDMLIYRLDELPSGSGEAADGGG